jgi:protein O-mannosyl-transferase
MIRKIFPFFLLIVFIVLIASPALHGDFVFDDETYIVHNPGIRNIGDYSSIAITPAGPYLSRYVFLFSLALNYHFALLDPFAYHFTNLLIHIVTALFVYYFVLLLLDLPQVASLYVRKGRIMLAFSVASLFAAHPVQTQAVSYISQRCVSLATLFYLMSLCFYLKGRFAAKNPVVAWAWISGALVTGLLGMFTKEIVITLPLMVILVELVFAAEQTVNRWKSIWRQRWWFVIILAAVLIVPAIFGFEFKKVLTSEQMSQSHDGDIINLWNYFITELRVAVEYLRLFLLPARQNFDYDFPLINSFWDLRILTSFAILTALAIVAFIWRKRNAVVSFGIFWFFIGFIPEFVPRANVIYEHKLYLLSIGLCIAVVTILADNVKDRRYFAAVLFVIVALAGFLTFQRNHVWRDQFSLWQDVVGKSPGKSRPLNSLGMMYFRGGDEEKALECFNQAIQSNEGNVEALNNRGIIYRKRKQYDIALRDFSRVLNFRPTYTEALNNRGVLYQQMGQDDLALADFKAAAAINPSFSQVHFNMGLIFEIRGAFEEASTLYTRAIETDAQNADAYIRRGIIGARLGRSNDAVNDFLKAVRLSPDRPDVYNNLGLLSYRNGDLDKSIEYYTKAIALKQDYRIARINRAAAYKTSRKYLEAINDYSFLIENAPQDGSLYFERALLYASIGDQTRVRDDMAVARACGYVVPKEYLRGR